MNNSYNPHIVFFKTAKEKSSPFMQFNLQDLKTCPKTPLSGVNDGNGYNPTTDKFTAPVGGIYSFYGPFKQRKVPLCISVDL